MVHSHHGFGMRDLRVCWPVRLGHSRIYLLISRLRAHPGPGRISRPTGQTQIRGRGGEGGRARVRETPAGGKGERATQVEPYEAESSSEWAVPESADERR